MSTEYDAVYLFEATEATEDDWEKCITRLRNGIMPYQQAVADCNPSSPKHWLKARADANKMKRIMSRHQDNPKVTEDYLASLAALSGHRRDRLYKGKWVAAEGLIYDMWDEATFVQRPEDFTPTRAVIGIDEGYTNPCSKHLYLIDGDGRLYIQRENYERQQLEAQVVETVQGWASEYTEILEAIIVDPSAAKLIGSLENVGLPVEPATNSVYDGIKAVQERLKVAGDGLPRTFIDPSCVNLIEEIGGYAWKENRDGSHEDKPTKQNDHAMDELRYVCMYLAETDGAYEVFKL
jgi:phage terminase large subunit